VGAHFCQSHEARLHPRAGVRGQKEAENGPCWVTLAACLPAVHLPHQHMLRCVFFQTTIAFDDSRSVLFAGHSDGSIFVRRLERTPTGALGVKLLRFCDPAATSTTPSRITCMSYDSALDRLYTGDMSGLARVVKKVRRGSRAWGRGRVHFSVAFYHRGSGPPSSLALLWAGALCPSLLASGERDSVRVH
jgi:hypothetical protein